MKKGSKALRSFNKVELGQVFNALHFYRRDLRPIEVLLFDLVFIKVSRRSNLHSLRDLVFDGMEMKLIAKALRKRADLYASKRNFKALLKFAILAQVAEEELYQFQKLNGPQIEKDGPQIEKDGPQIEKAPTVRAVSASR